MRHAWAKFRVDDRDGGLDFAQSYGVKAISFGRYRIDNLKFGYHISNIDKTALTAMVNLQKNAEGVTPTQEQQLAAGNAIMQQMVRAALKSRTSMKVEMSGAYKGHSVQLRGQVSLQGKEEIDLNDTTALFKRMNVRVHVRLPVALVREAATAFVGLEAGSRPQMAKTRNVSKQGRDMADGLVRQVLDEGYARLEKDILVATVEFRDGILRVNEKEVPFPQPRNDPRPDIALNFFDTRRKDAPCTLPDYPAEVSGRDLPYSLELALTIDSDGNASNGTWDSRSEYPDYDRALLEASMLCRYIPVLENGQVVDKTVSLLLSRESGSARP